MSPIRMSDEELKAKLLLERLKVKDNAKEMVEMAIKRRGKTRRDIDKILNDIEDRKFKKDF